MAVGPRDVGLTREDVWLWLKTYDGQLRDTKKLRQFLGQKIHDASLPDEMVDVSSRTDISGDEIHLLDMIMMDLESYK